MESFPGCESVDLDQGQLTLSWSARVSRTGISNIRSIGLNDSSVSQFQGLQDLLQTVQSLQLSHYRYKDISREKIIGEGETFLVEKCVVKNEVVAVKHLKLGAGTAGSSKFLRRLSSVILELRIMRHGPLRSHQNILKLIAYGWNDHQSSILPYILVEYSEFGHFREFLKAKPKTRLLAKESLIADVAAGLRALHLCRIIHGDVKLENILIFPSSDRPAGAIAKLSDFGHSLVLPADGGYETQLRYWGSALYNAPEVRTQPSSPILLDQLHKCDVWSFGLLSWEVLLSGDQYRNRLVNQRADACVDPSSDHFDHQQLLPLALKSITVAVNDIQKAFLKSLFQNTLQIDPAKRISDLTKLHIVNSSRPTLSMNTGDALVLHSGTFDWSYEIFQADQSSGIVWAHQKQIFQDFERCYKLYTKEESRAGSAAWQLVLCYCTGFGVSANRDKALEYLRKTAELRYPLAMRFGALLGLREANYTSAPDLTSYSTLVTESFRVEPVSSTQCIVSVQAMDGTGSSQEIDAEMSGPDDLQSWIKMAKSNELVHCKIKTKHPKEKAIPLLEYVLRVGDDNLVQLVCQKLPIQPFRPSQKSDWLIKACRTGDMRIVQALLNAGADPNSRSRDGYTMYHWLFMLGEDVESLRFNEYRPAPASLNRPCKSSQQLHTQWPLQLTGTPLAFAIAVGNLKTVEALLTFGADPLAPLYDHGLKPALDDRAYWTPIHLAVKYHSPRILNTLLKAANNRSSALPRGLLRTRSQSASTPRTPYACALPYSSPLERMAMHGALESQRLMETLQALEDEDHLGQSSPSGISPLMQAINLNDASVASALLRHSPQLTRLKFVDPKVQGRYTYPIHCAAAQAAKRDVPDTLDILRALHRNDRNGLLLFDSDLRTPLHHSVTSQSIQVTEWLLEQAPSLLNLEDAFGRTALHYSMSSSATQLLLERGILVDCTDQKGMSALHVAARSGLSHIVRVLLDWEARLDLHSHSMGTPLHCAIRKESWEIVNMLLDRGAPINAIDHFSDTPLNLAVQGSRQDLVRTLLGSGANSCISNHALQTPLHTAIIHRNISAVKLLLEKESSTTIVGDINEDTPLHLCAATGDGVMMTHLWERLATRDPDVLNKPGETPLHVAAKFAHTGIGRFLIEAGADVNAQNWCGCTPLHVVAQQAEKDGSNLLPVSPLSFCSLLLSAGASPDLEDCSGRIPWDIAAELENWGVMLLLLMSRGRAACRGLCINKEFIGNRFAEKVADMDLASIFHLLPKPFLTQELEHGLIAIACALGEERVAAWLTVEPDVWEEVQRQLNRVRLYDEVWEEIQWQFHKVTIPEEVQEEGEGQFDRVRLYESVREEVQGQLDRLRLYEEQSKGQYPESTSGVDIPDIPKFLTQLRDREVEGPWLHSGSEGDPVKLDCSMVLDMLLDNQWWHSKETVLDGEVTRLVKRALREGDEFDKLWGLVNLVEGFGGDLPQGYDTDSQPEEGEAVAPYSEAGEGKGSEEELHSQHPADLKSAISQASSYNDYSRECNPDTSSNNSGTAGTQGAKTDSKHDFESLAVEDGGNDKPEQ